MSGLASIFTGPDVPKAPPPPPAPPLPSDPAVEEERRRALLIARNARGRQSTILTGGLGVGGDALTARKSLLSGAA